MADEGDEEGDDEDDSDADSVYEEATTTCSQRLLIGFPLEMLNEALLHYGLSTERSRRKAADALADKLLYDTDDNED